MAQEYTVKDFKVGNFKDQNNNTWCTVVFNQDPGTPYTWVVKDPSTIKVGMTVYGQITDEVGKTSGKPYQRFRREQKPDGYGSAPSGSQASKPHDTDESIARAVALKAAVEYKNTTDRDDAISVLKTANIFLAWLKQEPVSGGQESTNKDVAGTSNAPESQDAAPYNPKKPWENRKPQPVEEPLPEYQPGEYDPYNDESFNPDQIPY